MELLITLIVSGVIVAIVTAIIQSKFIQGKKILPKTKEKSDSSSYKHLNGIWHQYHLSYDTSLSPDHFWTHHIENYSVHKSKIVEGTSENKYHPTKKIKYKLMGEIKHGRMILTLQNVNDPTDFGTMIYPNLLSGNIITGIIVGFDFQSRIYVAPLILSEKELDIDTLNKIQKSSSFKGIKFSPVKSAYIKLI